MRISYNLLKKCVPIKLKANELADLLNTHAFEVEAITEVNGFDKNIVTAEVAVIDKHPNADRLRVITLKVGGKKISPVVCGAHNFDVGDKVVLALPGARIAQNIHSATHESFVLEKATIRGIESQGMICAQFELGLTHDTGEEGIWKLPLTTPSGKTLNSILTPDWILEVSLPANRPDLHSHFGIAREIAAITNTPLPQFPKEMLDKGYTKIGKLPVEVGAFITVTINQVQIQSSPLEIRQLLENLGIQPVNNVVDATNIAMIELGHPLHAFDAAGVKGEITIRKAKKNESITLLNHKSYHLTPEVLVLADKNHALDMAGIMGGLDAEVGDSTKDIILTGAQFNGAYIRKTTLAMGLKSDASKLYEKGIAPQLTSIAINRTAYLIKEWAGGVVTKKAATAKNRLIVRKVRFDAKGVNDLLGTTLSTAEMIKILKSLGITITGQNATIPWWRPDLQDNNDLAEEIVRIIGLDNVVKIPLPRVTEVAGGMHMENFASEVREKVSRMGYLETRNQSFVSQQNILHFEDDPTRYVEIENPLSSEQQFLTRDARLPITLTLSKNARQSDKVHIFEIAKEYHAYLQEPTKLILAKWEKHVSLQNLLLRVKGEVELLLQTMGHTQYSTEVVKDGVRFHIGQELIAYISPLSMRVAKKMDLKTPPVFGVIEFDTLALLRKNKKYEASTRFPSIQRDISILVDDKILFSNIEMVIKSVSNLLTNLSIFEADYISTDKNSQEYHATLAKQNKKNLGIRLTFKALDRTLTDSEITGVVEQIMVELKKQCKAEIR